MELVVTIGAIENASFPAVLEYIAPKGTESNGAIQFEIRAQMQHDKTTFIRAGYSANADIVIARADSVLTIKESLLQFDGATPFVEIETKPQTFERKDLVLGISDGIQAEVKSGLGGTEKIKVWNQPQ
jgi:HlyD family secretion protein